MDNKMCHRSIEEIMKESEIPDDKEYKKRYKSKRSGPPRPAKGTGTSKQGHQSLKNRADERIKKF
jgi:hypothetical protein